MESQWERVNLARLSRETGLDRPTMYKWQEGADVTPSTVSAVAKALGANPIEAYIAAGYFTRAEFDEYRYSGIDDSVSNLTLAREVLRRMEAGAQRDVGPGDGPGSDDAPDVSVVEPNAEAEFTSSEDRSSDYQQGGGGL